MASALALAPPVPGDRFAVHAGTLGLLRAAGAERPALVLVDDAHWLDEGSLESVLFAARRLGDAPVLMIVAARAGAGRMPADPGIPVMEVGGLDESSAGHLLARSAPDLAPDAAAAVLAAAAGNPLALIELGGMAAEGATAWGAPDAPVPAGPSMERAVAARVEGLGEDAGRALLVAAAAGDPDAAPIAAACTSLGIAPAALEEAEAAGLVRLESQRVDFVHPLYRGAVYHRAPPPVRRRAHAALAGATTGERRAWHLAGAAVGVDEEAAAALEVAADMATLRHGHSAAAVALERAADLSPDATARARRLLGAAMASAAAGRGRDGLALLDRAERDATSPALIGTIGYLHAVLLMWDGADIPDARRRFVEMADLVADADPVRAATLLADAATGATMAGDCRDALELSERAAGLLGDGGAVADRAQVLAILGWSLVLRGEHDRARTVLRQVDAMLPEVDPLSPAARSIALALNSRVPFEEYERARDEAGAMVAAARENGALGSLPFSLVVVADSAYRLGEWDLAEQAGSEGVRLAEEFGQRIPLGHAEVTLARLDAARGRAEVAARRIERARRISTESGLGSGDVFAAAVSGFLQLGLGRTEDAAAELERTRHLVEHHGLEEPSLVPWAQDLVEALARQGRIDEAARELARFEVRAERAGTAGPRAAVARCRGLLAGADYEDRFREALELHACVPMPFETARTELVFGERLHRERRRGDARTRLRSALATFERLGAGPWAERARAALRAAGAVRRPESGRRPGELSDQELRVALAVGRGATNRQVAAELFVSPKTVEFHLGNVYRKLGIRSRSQLSALVAGGGFPTAADS